MRVPQWLNDFFDWRWAPCVGLTAGSLAFVALALLLIPTRFGGEPRVVSSLSAYESQRPQRAIFSSALARPDADADERPAEIARNARIARAVSLPPPRGPEAGASQRGFSPILERAEPVPTPAPPVPPPAPPSATPEPPAAPTGSAVIQPGPGPESREVRQ